MSSCLQIRRKNPASGIAELYGQGQGVELGEGEVVADPAHLFKVAGQLGDERAVKAFYI